MVSPRLALPSMRATAPEKTHGWRRGNEWLIKIKPAADADFDSLLDAEAYKALINE